MYCKNNDNYYYLTLLNENYAHPKDQLLQQMKQLSQRIPIHKE